jgi:predicted TIM-barrel enzyme
MIDCLEKRRFLMVKRFTRSEIIERLQKTHAESRPILVACCGAGIIAKCAALAGADIIMTACTSKSRLMGLPTTILGNVNEDMIKLLPELTNVVKDTPIVASLEATDPRWMDLSQLVEEAAAAGYSGVLNYPTLSPLLGHERRQVRESVGLGFAREVEMMRVARKKDLFTIAYTFNTEDAKRMAEGGVDCLVAHVGSTKGGLAGFQSISLAEGAELVQEIIRVAKSIDPQIICLGHGGPFATPEDTQYLYQHTDAVGFVGASSIERIPIEKAVREAVVQFKSISLPKKRRM